MTRLVDIRRALRLHDGNITRAARELALPPQAIRSKVKQHRLSDFVHTLRSQRRQRAYQKVMDLLVKHQGSVTAVARELGIRTSSLSPTIERYGLRDLVLALRPRKPSPEEEKARILDAIRRNLGQMWRVRQELGLPKSTLLVLMHKHDLFAEADALRIEANLTGPRTRLPQGRNRSERRAKLIALLETCDWKVSRAHRLAGVSAGTFYTMMHDLRIDRPKVEQRHRLHRLVDALRLSNGILERAARVLGVQARTVRRWCDELDVEPREYRV